MHARLVWTARVQSVYIGFMDTASDTTTSVAALLAAEIGEFITAAEAAAILRVTKQTIYNLCDSGAFGPVIRVGRGRRIPAAGFRAYASPVPTAA